MKKAPTSKRPTPKDIKRLGWLTGRKLTPKQQAEHEALFARWGEWSAYRDQSGTAYTDTDGKTYAPCTERRARRIVKVRAWHVARLEPDAKKERKQQANRETISPSGGLAAAKNKEDDIFRVLREYKRTHPWHKMTAACEKIVDARLLDYSNREKLIKRLSDIGKRMNPVKSPSQIYAEL